MTDADVVITFLQMKFLRISSLNTILEKSIREKININTLSFIDIRYMRSLHIEQGLTARLHTIPYSKDIHQNHKVDCDIIIQRFNQCANQSRRASLCPVIGRCEAVNRSARLRTWATTRHLRRDQLIRSVCTGVNRIF